jgi:bifunctional non-homologous end joining protein LigD
MTITPIIPLRCQEPFDDAGHLFELKYDGFRALCDTVNGRVLSKNRNRMRKYEPLLNALPEGLFDGEIVALDERGRPMFKDLLFGRRQATYIPFDVMVADGEDIRGLPLKERKARLDKVVRRYGLEKTEPFFAEGRALFNAVCRLDLEGLVAKKLEDAYSTKTKWFKILNPGYTQKEGRGELFEGRYG